MQCASFITVRLVRPPVSRRTDGTFITPEAALAILRETNCIGYVLFVTVFSRLFVHGFIMRSP
jgi:hypothetical protein